MRRTFLLGTARQWPTWQALRSSSPRYKVRCTLRLFRPQSPSYQQCRAHYT
jgi:hypothetical protein